tara:strand:- start:37291 stop:42633 length:5343 start_codon:yes stop_codon:yes gene_type:complete
MDFSFSSLISNNILFEWSVAVSIVVSVSAAVFVALILLTNFFTDNRASDRRKIFLESIKSVFSNYLLQILNILLEIVRKLTELPTTLLIIWNTILSNLTLILILGILSGISYTIFNYDQYVLMSLDSFYRCNVTPFVNNILLSALHVLALIWGAILPILNFVFVLIRQILVGSFSIASKCTLTTFTYFDYIIGWTEVFVEFLLKFLDFTGATAGFTASNNFFVNRFDIVSIVAKVRELHAWIPSIFSCLCEQINLVWNILFYPLQDAKIDQIVDYFFNFFISLGQVFVQIVPPFLKYPDFAFAVENFENLIFSSSELLDNWLLYTINKILEIIGKNAATISIESPDPFIFKTTGHAIVGTFNALETVGNVTLHTLLPVDPAIPFSDYGKIWSLDKTFYNYNLFISYGVYLLHWFSRVTIELLDSDKIISFCKDKVEGTCVNEIEGSCSVECTGSDDGSFIIKNMYPDCKNKPTEATFFNALACTVESFAKGTMNIFVVSYRLFLTFWWDVLPTIFEGNTIEENDKFFPILRDHVGPWFSRDQNPRCFPDVFTIPRNDPSALYCKRANVNEHVLFYFDRTGEYFWSLLEPTSFGKIGLYLTTKPINEFIRILLRIVSSLDIFFKQGSPYYKQKILAGYWVGPNRQPYPLLCQMAVADKTGVAEISLAEVFDDAFSYNPEYKDEYTNEEIENWCNINIFEWIFIYTKRATEGVVRVLDIFADSKIPNQNRPDKCLEPDSREPYNPSGEHAPSINRLFRGYTTFKEGDLGRLNKCELEGVKSYKCSIGHVVTVGVELFRTFIRSQVRQTLSVLSGGVVNMDFTQHICNLQKFEFAVAGIIGTLSPVTGKQKQGIEMIIYSVIDIIGSYALVIQKLITELIAPEIPGSQTISLAAKFASGQNHLDLGAEFRDIIGKLLDFLIDLVYENLRQFIDGLDLLSRGSPVFAPIKEILGLLRDLIKLIKDVIFSTIRLGLNFIGLLYGKVRIDDFSGQLIDFATLTLKALSSIIMRIVGIFLDNLDIFGKIVKQIIAGLCSVAQHLHDTSFGQFPVLDCEQLRKDLELEKYDSKEVKEAKKVEADIDQGKDDLLNNEVVNINGVGYTYKDALNMIPQRTPPSSGSSSKIGRRRRLLKTKNKTKFRTKKNRTYIQNMINAFSWNGESECDMIMIAYKNYDPVKISPLENIKIVKCYEYREMGYEIHKVIPLVPEDILYNWWRKYILAFDMTRAAIIYISSLVKGDSMSTLKHKLTAANINAVSFFKVIQNTKRLISSFNIHKIHEIIKEDLIEHSNNNNYVASWYLNATNSIGGIYTIINSKQFQESSKADIPKVWNSLNFSNHNLRLPTFNEIFSNETKKHLKRFTNKDKQRPILFGKIYTDLKCNPNSPLCLNCALVDNFIYSAFDAANVSATFYSNGYRNKVVPEFKQYWVNVTEYNVRYIKGSVTSNTVYGSYEEPYYSSDIYPSYRLFDFNTYFNGLWAGTRSPQEILDNIEYFFAGNYSGSIPNGTALMFGPTDVQYILEWPFQQDCTDAEFLYESKVNRVGYGLLSVAGLYVLYFVITRFLTGVPPEPFGLIINSFLPIISFLLYLVVVYQYNPLCLPSQNVWLFYDLLGYLEDYLFLDCFCAYVPFLSKIACEQATCDTCKIADFTNSTYYACTEPNLVTGLNELHIGWHFVFFVRWYFTETFVYLEQLQLWPLTFVFEIDGIRMLVEDAKNNVPISGIEESCFYLNIGIPISVLLLLYLIILCLIPFIDFIAFYLKEVFLLVLYVLLSVYQLGKTLLDQVT